MHGVAGFMLGFGSTAFNFAAGWWAVQLIGKMGQQQAPPRWGAMLATLAFLIKLPVWIVAGITSQRLEGSHPACFLGGLALVYFGTVGRYLVSRNE